MATRLIDAKTVLVTGSNRGIGLQFVKQFLSKGNHVVATARNVDKATELQRLVSENEGKLTVAPLDLCDPESIARLPSEIPFERVDVVVNNAGVSANFRSLEDTSSGVMMDTFRVNTVGPLLVAQAMVASGKFGGGDDKAILANVTSKMGSIDDNGSGGSYAYRASKCALNIVTKSLSIDLQDKNIDTILLHPGWVRTDMTNGRGLIDDVTSVKGMISVLEDQPELNGKWFDYKHEAIPW
ncbi:short-chain dehydrogenase/reductase [Chloropicon primus]|uniref:Short-chain dehydrogenase/reductase n=1 Tax=Chloropicon primus TaxID=1764295 RepID=A0A5B8MVF8_9CHLO|nr:short-chain dehydrogenase/reductase [Chloropicon primus]UPR03575.1 short-chain dehydrogenase/reductase [Chloropicon primus]|eukprot:QDZ24367.1 short-chain dehydrogenase/reductase [Chloropicon primus]